MPFQTGSIRMYEDLVGTGTGEERPGHKGLGIYAHFFLPVGF